MLSTRGTRVRPHTPSPSFLPPPISHTLPLPTPQKQIHRAYLEGNADIIETCTFNGTDISMADYHMEGLVREINFEAAKLAKKVRGPALCCCPISGAAAASC